MTQSSTQQILAQTTVSKSDRITAFQAIRHGQKEDELLKIIQDPTNHYHVKACWILEFYDQVDLALMDNLSSQIIPYLHSLSHESALRPVAKFLSLWLQVHKKQLSLTSIDTPLLNELAENTFEWLISDHKVALKVHSMQILGDLILCLPWIKDALVDILQKEIDDHSPGYRARAKAILKKIT